jgi:hypothetical protein
MTESLSKMTWEHREGSRYERKDDFCDTVVLKSEFCGYKAENGDFKNSSSECEMQR